MYNNGNWKPSYSKVKDKRKSLTLFACPWCKGKGTETIEIDGENWFDSTHEEVTCPTCNGTRKQPRKISARESEYYKLMKEDREACGMKFIGRPTDLE